MSNSRKKNQDKVKHKQAPKMPAKKHSAKNRHPKIIFSLSAVIFVLAFVLYANTLNHGYTLDDFSVIKENNVVTQGTGAISTILNTSYRYGYLSVNDGLYRPFSLVMFAIEWEYFPNSPEVSHFINVLFYALTGVLLFLLFVKLLKGYSIVVSFVTVVLFIAHPIHTEIVASIKSRDEIMCFFLMVLSFYYFVKREETNKMLPLVVSMVSFFLAMLSKETGITMLVVFPLMMYFFLEMNISKIIIKTIPFIVVTGIYFMLRAKVLDSATSLEDVSYIDNSLVAAPDMFSKLATAMKVLGMYLQLLLFPHPLVCDRSFNQIPNVTFADIMSLISLAVYIGMFVYAIIGIKKKDLVSFGILFYLITIALFSNIFILIGSVMAERFVYFSSFGFCLVIAVLLSRAVKVEKDFEIPARMNLFFQRNIKVMAICIPVILLYAFKTIDRNADWKNNFTLYTHDVNISSASTRMHYYLGRELIKDIALSETNEEKRREYLKQGIAELEKALEIVPTYSDAYSQMGLGYSRLGNKEKAIECYMSALKHQPNDPISMNNLAAEYFTQGKYMECIDIYKKVLQIDPRYVDAMVNLGSCYGTIGDHDNAIIWFKKATEHNPNNAQAYQFLSMAYKFKGDAANANLYYQKAIELNPALKQQ